MCGGHRSVISGILSNTPLVWRKCDLTLMFLWRTRGVVSEWRLEIAVGPLHGRQRKCSAMLLPIIVPLKGHYPLSVTDRDASAVCWCIDPIFKNISTDPQTAAGEVDGVNLEEIREFAKAFKIRRLSLGLTQTQVGQALSATEGPAYSQSAICR